MSKFKVGDTVEVVKHPTSISGTRLIGKIGKVVKACDTWCVLDLQTSGIWYLELVLANPDWDE